MSSFAFLHAADLHIDSPLRGIEAGAPGERIRGATRAAFTNLVDLALRERVAFVVIAGDLFDGAWQDWRTGHFFTSEARRLTEAGIRVVLIRGNHDAESVIVHRLSLPDGVRMLGAERPESVRIAECGAWIHGQSFATREVTANLARGYPPPQAGGLNIGLLHSAVSGRDGHAPYAPCTVEQLAAHGYDYWALGHVHTREVLSRAPWIVFPGNTQGRHVNEPGPRGASLVVVQDGRVADVVHHDLDTVRWSLAELDVGGAEDQERVFAAVRRRIGDELAAADGRLLALRLVLVGACPAHAALARDPGATAETLIGEAAACAAPEALWLESARLSTRPALDRATLAGRGDAVGLLVRAIEAAEPDAFVAETQRYCTALLDRAAGLRDGLGRDHPAVLAAGGELAPELLARARDLLLARLAEGG
jgi:hypothetical protein